MVQAATAPKPESLNENPNPGDLTSVRDAAAKIVAEHRSGKLSSEQAAEALRKLSRSRQGFFGWLLDL